MGCELDASQRFLDGIHRGMKSPLPRLGMGLAHGLRVRMLVCLRVGPRFKPSVKILPREVGTLVESAACELGALSRLAQGA